MRGTRLSISQVGVLLGIIPADAGNTALGEQAGFEIGDHPRGCGEHRPITYMAYMLWGSSPRMRGTLL